jgi:hypothetical protein
MRLNNQIPEEKRARQSVELKHAFINPLLLDEYLACPVPPDRVQVRLTSLGAPVLIFDS